jgi:hypothetical protein
VEKQQNVLEKLVELIDQVRVVKTEYGVCIGGSMRIADHLIANGVTFAGDINVPTKWISVKDRLPDKDGCYIVTACDEGCSCGDGIWYDTVVIEAEHYKGEWSWNENGTEYDITDFVTHWQPMPQPPKGE